jgi:hypothetical protein
MQFVRCRPGRRLGARAAELAHWSWAHLVNRTDAWGGYRPLHERGKVYTRRDGTRGEVGTPTTPPAPSARGRVLLTEEVLACHYRGRAVEHVVGLHSTSSDNTCRWGAVDVDHHADGGTTDPAVNLAAALAWYRRLRQLGFAPLLTDSNGAGGYHLRVLFSEPATAPRVHAFLCWLVRDCDQHGMSHPPESFPKQAHLQPGRFGNWLRLPGRHHTREHWSRVWDGGRWLEGTAAVDHILAQKGSPACLIPDCALAARPGSAAHRRPPRASKAGDCGGALAARIRAYLAKLPSGLGEGQHRDDVAYNFAAFLVRDLGLPDSVAMTWLNEWDRGNLVQKGEARLKEILANAHAYGQRALGSGLHRPLPSRPGKHRLTHLRFTVEV